MHRSGSVMAVIRRAGVLLAVIAMAAACGGDEPTLLSADAPDNAAQETPTQDAAAQATTTLLPARIRLDGTNWVVTMIDGGTVFDTGVGFVGIVDSSAGRVQAFFGDACGAGQSMLLPTEDPVVKVLDVSYDQIEGCTGAASLTAFFVPDTEITIEFFGPDMVITAGDRVAYAEHFNAESVQIDEPLLNPDCTPRGVYEFPTTIPGEWWCDE